jgi:hypothetical protein
MVFQVFTVVIITKFFFKIIMNGNLGTKYILYANANRVKAITIVDV